MNVNALKHAVLERRHQLATLDREGRLLQSCDSIIPIAAHAGSPVLDAFPALQGMRDTILGLPDDEHLHLSLVEVEHEGSPMLLNMEFWVEEKEGMLCWMMSREDGLHLRKEQVAPSMGAQDEGATVEACARKLEQAQQALHRFSYIVSHDLKAPLRAIGNLSEWIQEAVETKDYDELPLHLKLLDSRVKRMGDLIEGILRYHRAGKEPAQIEHIDMRALLTELYERTFDGVPCEFVLPEALPVIECCRSRVYQVFSNLFSNALKYAPAPQRRLEVAYMDLDTQHKFGVIDNGPGIDPKHHGRIFEIFQTLQSKDEDASTGVGLSIVQRIVTESGGTVWIDSEVGRGATFWFALPKIEGGKRKGH